MLAEDCTHSDKHAACSEVTDNERRNVKLDLLPLVHGLLESLVPESSYQDCDLKSPSTDQEVEADRCPAVRLQEHHKEAKANKDHDMNILKQWVKLLHFVGGGKRLGAG